MHRPPPTPAAAPAVRAPRVRQSRWLGLISVSCFLSVLFLLPVTLEPVNVQRYYLALVLTALTFIPLVARLASGSLDIFEPIIPISLLIGLSYGFRAMYIAYTPEALAPIRSGMLPFEDYIERALLLTMAGYGAMLAGYFVLAAPLGVKPLAAMSFARRTWAPARLDAWKIAVLLGIAVFSSLATRSADPNTVAASTTLRGMTANFAQVTAAILALHMAAGDRRWWLRAATWAVALPLAAWQSLALAGKTYVLQFVHVVVAGRHYAKRRVSPAAVAVGVIVLVLVVFPTVNLFRIGGSERDTGTFAPRAFVDQVIALPLEFAGMTPGEYAQLALDNLMSRSTGVDALSLVMKYDVSKELGNPAAYAYIPFYAFIPRAIWPDKPVLRQGVLFGRLLLIPSFVGAQSFTPFGIFHIGDLFVSFGVAGVMIGMCVMGFAYRLLYKFLDPQNSPDLGIKFLYILVLWGMVNGFESDIPSTYANLLKSLLVWSVLKVWLNAPVPGEAPRRVTAARLRPWAPGIPFVPARSRLTR